MKKLIITVTHTVEENTEGSKYVDELISDIDSGQALEEVKYDCEDVEGLSAESVSYSYYNMG